MDMEDVAYLEQMERTIALSVETAKEEEQRRLARKGGLAQSFNPGRSESQRSTVASYARGCAHTTPAATVQKSLSMPTFSHLYADLEAELESAGQVPATDAQAPGGLVSGGLVSGGLVMRRSKGNNGETNTWSKDSPDGGANINPHRPRPRPRPIVPDSNVSIVVPLPPPPPAKPGSSTVMDNLCCNTGDSQQGKQAGTKLIRGAENILPADGSGASAVESQLVMDVNQQENRHSSKLAVTAVTFDESPPLIDLTPVLATGMLPSNLLSSAQFYPFPLHVPPGKSVASSRVNALPLPDAATKLQPSSNRSSLGNSSYYSRNAASPPINAVSMVAAPLMIKRTLKKTDDLLDLSADVGYPPPDSYDLKHFDPLMSPDADKPAFDSQIDDMCGKVAQKPQYLVVPRQGSAWPVHGLSENDQPSIPETATRDDTVLQDPFSLEELSLALLVQTRTRKSEAAVQPAPADRASAPAVPTEKARSKIGSARESHQAVCSDSPPVARRQTDNEERQSKVAPVAAWQEEYDESKAFASMVSRLKAEYLSGDHYTNGGVVLSPMVCMPRPEGISVKVDVLTMFKKEPVVFTCDVNTAVEAVIGNVLCMSPDELQDIQPDNYLLRVAGLSEFLLNDSVLSEYEYVRRSLKLDETLQFILFDASKMVKPFKRSSDDDSEPVYMINYSLHGDKSHKHSSHDLDVLIDIYLKEHDLFRSSVVKVYPEANIKDIRMQGLLQSVKAITTLLGDTETLEIRNSLQQVRRAASEDSARKSEVLLALDNLSKDVASLLLMYCKTFRLDYSLPPSLMSAVPQKAKKDVKDLTSLLENVIIHIASVHRLPINILNRFEQFKISCQLYHGDRKLFKEVATPSLAPSRSQLSEALYWDHWLELSNVPLCTLPRETRLVLVLNAYDAKLMQWLPLGWVAMSMFDHKGHLAQGGYILSLWQGNPNPTGTTGSNIWQPKSIVLLVSLPEFDWAIRFPQIESLHDQTISSGLTSSSPLLTDEENRQLQSLLESDASTLSKEQQNMLWEKRFYLCDNSMALALVLSCVPCWSYSGLHNVIAILRVWKPLPLLSALNLLLPKFPNTEVRLEAVHWLRECSNDELCDCMPQLVQVLKFESYHDSPLAQLLLERSMISVRFAHRLYWTLLDAAALQPHYRERFMLLYGGLMSVVGSALREEFQMEDRLIRLIGTVAEKVKEAREKEAVLERELWNVCDELQQKGKRRLPINPGMEATGVDTKLCTYFNSFTTPLRLVFANADENAGGHYLMYKIGDDIRQDMLVMQIMRQMDRLWLKNDLDLRMMTFECVPLGDKRGLVELITGCETLRKIQLSYGITGSFKDQPVSEWLKKHNPTEFAYEKAVENFTLTCAGCCVATYVLGICDRHNDNIMLKNTGHMFHIDFSKFLGDAQMFGKIKRDRAPFVFTSDMAYVINGGDKPTEKFQQFIDLCCEAFNIVRRNADTILTLIAAMQQCGIPGVNEDGLAYVQRALLPGRSEFQATMHFTQMIEESLKSVFTQLNFFFHNLAQLKFFNHNDGELLSFASKTYSLATDGRIKTVEILSYQKRYAPEKHYVYVMQVFREHQRDPTLVFRRYSEFQEFYTKLMDIFPHARLPVLSGSIILGRTHVQRVAERRKLDIECFLRDLLHQSPEISEHDLVYTFFHPVLGDEKETDRTDISKSRDSTETIECRQAITGQVKLSLVYSDSTLCVMVMHAKRLANETGEPPHPYVKTYLLPDPIKSTKRKTKTAKSTFNPTYNEMLHYRMPMADLRRRTLQVSVWSDGMMRENVFLGQVNIPLVHVDLSKETCRWYALSNLPDRWLMDASIA